jgi:TRAP-type mannitol/chloroaromatic compound transport system permease large subunit
MSIELFTIIFFASMLIVFATGMPIGFALGFLAMVFGPILMGKSAFYLIPLSTFSSITNFLLLAVPLFIFMGHILQRSGIGNAMFNAMYIIAGRIRVFLGQWLG